MARQKASIDAGRHGFVWPYATQLPATFPTATGRKSGEPVFFAIIPAAAGMFLVAHNGAGRGPPNILARPGPVWL